jgi:hypothetical protein
MTDCTLEKFDQATLGRLKESALGLIPKQSDFVDAVRSLAGCWAAVYNALRSFELECCFDFSPEGRRGHVQNLGAMIAVGCDLLLLIHSVEDESDPKVDFSQLHEDLTGALCALRLSRSSMTHSIADIELQSFAPSDELSA